MPKGSGLFEFVGPTAAGDQPKAIAGLVEGLERGEKRMTLLGATGTGKSVAWSEPITIQTTEGLHRGPIGELIDRVLGPEQFAETVEAIPPGDWQVVAWDTTSGRTSWQKITGLSRHVAPAIMFTMKTTCGRMVEVTGDHSVWVLREGNLTLVKGDSVRLGDALPIPRRLPAPPECASLNLLELLGHRGLFGRIVSTVERSVLEQYTGDHRHPKEKAYRVWKEGEGLSLPIVRRLVKDHIVGLDAVQIGGKKITVPAQFPITDALLTLLGQYVAEGDSVGRRVQITVRDPEVHATVEQAFRTCHLPFSLTKDGDFLTGSVVWFDLFHRYCGGHAGEKRLPCFWVSLSDRQLGALLRAYFEGDGGVEKGGVLAISLNPELMADIAEALLRFGIWARLRVVKKKKPNGDYGTYTKLTISGAMNLRRYADCIGFLSRRKSNALSLLLGRPENTNVDLIFGVGPALKQARQMAGLIQEKLAEKVGCSKGMVRALESGRRNPSRALFLRFCEHLPVSEEVRGLANLYWSPVERVEQHKPTSKYVYDLSVDGFETFLTGRGGLFVHNTHTIGRVIAQVQRPTLVMAHNKTLVAQLCTELKECFPNNAVEYFVSYFDYYQPEAYIPQTDTFIEKDSSVNEEINRLRHSATQAILSRRDTIIVASVSCIYGLGSPQEYKNTVVWFEVGQSCDRDDVMRRLVSMQFARNDIALTLGTFRVKGDTLEIQPVNEEVIYRIEFDWDTVSRITSVDPVTGETLDDREELSIFPATHWVSNPDKLDGILKQIEDEMEAQVKKFESEGKLIEAQRIRQRTNFDLEMIREMGFCSGIENYSRWFDERGPGSPPNTLLEYFPDDFLIVLDESHQTIPQLHAMYAGDKRRKDTLVEYGFRLPSAADNRPLRFPEFEKRAGQLIFVSATPGPYEREHSERIVQQIIRPTGLIDPEIEIRPSKGQIDDLIGEIRDRVDKGERALVTTLTKKMAEDLTEYLIEIGIKVQYLHSDVHTLERSEILRDLRLGVYDVIVGINLLREGLDLPEVSLVAILDADKEGFLRSETSLIQTIGRAARNSLGIVLMYADTITGSMRRAIDETNRRRAIQVAHNTQYGITPTTIKKAIQDVLAAKQVAEAKSYYKVTKESVPANLPLDQLLLALTEMEKEMKQAAKNLDFEQAALLRDEIGRLKKLLPTEMKKK